MCTFAQGSSLECGAKGDCKLPDLDLAVGSTSEVEAVLLRLFEQLRYLIKKIQEANDYSDTSTFPIKRMNSLHFKKQTTAPQKIPVQNTIDQ